MRLKLVLLVVGFFFPFLTYAGHGYLYESTFYRQGKDYLSRLAYVSNDRLQDLPDDKRRVCQDRYSSLLKDGVLDIRIALGYFDWTTGSPLRYYGENYGYSPSMDIGGFYALSSILTSSCRGNNQLCGFRRESGNMYRFSKPIRIRGKTYTARVEVQFSSETELLSRNTGRYSANQSSRSQYTESFFKNALRNADVTFYFGHSRNGGGPDFNPPVFVPGTNKLNYSGYYKAKRPGLNKMINALSSSDDPTEIVGMFSCDSRDHFLRKIRAVSPHTGVITSLDILTVTEVWTAMNGALDSLLRGQCQKSFYQSLRMTAGNQRYMTMDGVFE